MRRLVQHDGKERGRHGLDITWTLKTLRSLADKWEQGRKGREALCWPCDPLAGRRAISWDGENRWWDRFRSWGRGGERGSQRGLSVWEAEWLMSYSVSQTTNWRTESGTSQKEMQVEDINLRIVSVQVDLVPANLERWSRIQGHAWGPPTLKDQAKKGRASKEG